MGKTQELFHDLSNWHNKISVVAGVAREIFMYHGLASLKQEELDDKNSYLINLFSQIEQFVFSANNVVIELRKVVSS